MMEDGVQGGRARASACMGCNANDLFVGSASRATRRAMRLDGALTAVPMVRSRRRAASRDGTDSERARV